MANKKKVIRTTVSVPAEDHAELERIAAAKKVSMAWVVRDAIETYIERKTDASGVGK